MKQECLPLGGGIKSQVDSNTSRITSLENGMSNYWKQDWPYAVGHVVHPVSLRAGYDIDNNFFFIEAEFGDGDIHRLILSSTNMRHAYRHNGTWTTRETYTKDS